MALRPLKYGNTTSVAEMSNTDIDDFISKIIGADFATNSGVGSLGVGSLTNGTSIGTWVDTYRNDPLGTHPVDPANVTSVSTTLYQDVSNGTATGTPTRPLGWNAASGGIQQLTDNDIDTIIIAKVASYIVNGGAGCYVLQPTAPVTGTWVSRGTLTDTVNGSSSNTYLWQRTVDTISTTTRPLKYDTVLQTPKQMSNTEITSLTYKLRNYIVTSGVGQYKLANTIPVSGGTWIQAGSGFDDTRLQASDVGYNSGSSYTRTFTGAYSATYTGIYNQAFTGVYAASYSGVYSGAFTGAYTGVYTPNYTGVYSSAYTGTYSGNYTSYYAGSRAKSYQRPYTGGWYTGYYAGNYASTYTGAYTGVYGGSYTGLYVGAVPFTGQYTGVYVGSFTGSFTGINYTGVYTPTYTGTYTGYYAGSRAKSYQAPYTGGWYTGYYAGNYAGAYSGTYLAAFTGARNVSYTGLYNEQFTGTYGGFTGLYTKSYTQSFSGLTIIATPETVQTTKLWVRTA